MHSNTKLHTTCPKLPYPTFVLANQAFFRPVWHFKPPHFIFLSLPLPLPPPLQSPLSAYHLSNHLLYHPHYHPHPHHHSLLFIFLTLSPHPLWMRGSLLWGGSQLDYQASVAVSTWLVEDGLRHSIQSILSPKETKLKGQSIALQLIHFILFFRRGHYYFILSAIQLNAMQRGPTSLPSQHSGLSPFSFVSFPLHNRLKALFVPVLT